ncbi:hypothetical protein EV368DRAFT_65308 [Lentinula lateritia]|nr:hypothetical protein EV368DRAFT_65308 [Lentinula lateritia]
MFIQPPQRRRLRKYRKMVGKAGSFQVLIRIQYHQSIHGWYMVLGSGVMYSLSMLILAMAHKQSTSDEVPFFLDLLEPNWLQAQAMVSLMGSICVYAVQFPVPSLILFLVITIALLIVGSSQPQNVERSPEHFYCHFTNNIG